MAWLKGVKTKYGKKEMPEVEEYKLKDNEIENLSELFVSQDEKYIASLGNGYIINYLANKSMSKGFAFITDKRVYFKGSCLHGEGKKLVKTNEERTVDIKNITGSGFIYRRYWGLLFALFFSVLLTLFGALRSFVWSTYVQNNARNDFFSEIHGDYEKKVLYVLKESEFSLTDYAVAGDKMERFQMLAHMNMNGTNEFWTIWGEGDNSGNVHIKMYCGNYGEFEYYIDEQGRNIKRFKVYEYEFDGLTHNDVKDWRNTDEVKELLIEYMDKQGVVLSKGEALGASISFKVLSALFIALTIVCCKGIKDYLLKRKTLFRIEYAGGCIAFNVTFYAKAEIDDFQKQLRRAKDLAEEKESIKTVVREKTSDNLMQSNAPDDLRKYAELLKDGLISQEEYDAMKKKILGL